MTERTRTQDVPETEGPEVPRCADLRPLTAEAVAHENLSGLLKVYVELRGQLWSGIFHVAQTSGRDDLFAELYAREREDVGALAARLVMERRAENLARYAAREGAMTETLGHLFWSPALPAHWVGEADDGSLWTFPCDPIAPEAWGRRERYLGHREALREATPQACLVACYRGTPVAEVQA